MCTMEVMRLLEQQVSEIVDVMYDSVPKQNFDRVSNDVDRVSGAVDNDFNKIDTDSIKYPMTMLMISLHVLQNMNEI